MAEWPRVLRGPFTRTSFDGRLVEHCNQSAYRKLECWLQESKGECIMRSLVCLGLASALMAASGTVWAQQDLKGEVKIDGSSTVYLISQAMVTHFKTQHPNVGITVGKSGTGAGFKKFANGETDINDASRAVKPAE